jgi:hypothetical protein
MNTPQPWLEQLIAWATPPETTDDLVAARKEYFAHTGEVFDDDRQLEQRMAAFLEHYVCDRVAPHYGVTPARARYLEALKDETPERAAAWRAFTETHHGLFEVRKLKGPDLRLKGLFSGVDHDITERRQLVGLAVGDVLECRLVPFAGYLHFSPAWIFHPHEAAKAIKAEARRLQKAGPVDEAGFVADCSQRSLKAERYRQIAVEKIYDFSSRRF